MANIIKWAKDRKDDVLDVASRAYDTVNIADGGRSWTTRTPTDTRSSVMQTASFVNRNVVQPAIATGQRTLNTAGAFDAGVKGLASVGLNTITGNKQGANDAIVNTQRVMNQRLNSGFGGKGGFVSATNARTRGGGIQGYRDTFVKPVLQGTAETAPYVIPIGGAGAGMKLLPRVGVQAGANAVVSGASDAANQYAQTGRVDVKQVAQSAATGAAFGGAAPVAGAAVRYAAPIVRQGVTKSAAALQEADRRAFTPRVNLDDQNALRAMSDYLAGASKETGADLSATIRGARAAAAKYGININNGNRAADLEAVNSVLDQIGQKNKTVGQGGYIKIGEAADDPMPPSSLGQVLEQRKELPPVPSTTIERPNVSRLNTKRLNLPDEARARLDSDTAEVINRLSNEDVMRAAKSAGIDTKSYTPEKTRQKIAEQLNLRKDTVRLQNEAEAARVAGDFDRAAQLLKESAEAGRTSRTQGTDIARQLQARRIIANELDTPPQKVFKLLDNAGVDPDVYTKRFANVDFNNSDDVVRAYREMVPPTGWDWLDVVRYNSMLSSPLTHIVNVGSNALNVGLIAPLEKTIRGIADATGGLFGKERKYAAGEGAAYATGAAKSIKEAANNFVDAMRNGSDQTPDLSDISTPLAVGGAKGATYQTLSFPMKLLGASDKFFRTLAEAGEDRALTARENAGIKLNGNKQAMTEAEASYRLYQQDTDLDGQGAILKTIDQVANSIQTLRKKNKAFGFVFPFVKTPTNILKQGVEFSPLGFANLPGVDDKLTAITRASIGTAVFGASAAMLASGDLTWAEPINPEEKARWRAEGKQPYGMRINGSYVNFSKLPPAVAFPFALTAAIDDAINNQKMDQNTADAIMQGVAKWGQFIGDQSYLKQVGDTLALVKGDPEKAVQAVSNYPQQLIPFRALTGWVARMTDDTERKINTDKSNIDKQVQSLMLNYPGLRQNIDTRNYRGEPIPANNPVLNSVIPFKVTDDRGVNPIDAELDAAKKAEDKSPLLTDAQNKEVANRSGASIKRAQEEFLKTEEYQSLSPEDRKRGLEAIKKDITEIESRKYQAENNVGMYAQDYKGEEKKLSNRQTAIENGNFDAASYATKGDSTNTTVLKGDTRGTALLDKVGTMNKTQLEEWESKPLDNEYKDVYDRAQNIRAPGLPDLPKSNATLRAYATYLKNTKDSASTLSKDEAKRDFLVASYQSGLSKQAKELYGQYSVASKINAVKTGAISKADFEAAINLDNALVASGLITTPKISNKMRNALGYGDAPSSGGSGGGKSALGSLSYAKPQEIGRARQANFSVRAPQAPRFSTPKVRKPKVKTDNLNRLLGATKFS